MNATTSESTQLNERLVADLQLSGRINSPEVAEAFTATPRHLFLPGVAIADAYKDDSVFTDRDDEGRPVSSVSAPWLVAAMLEYLSPRPGDSVMEIGSGGYNAALLRSVVGPDGAVTSIDIDPAVIDRARLCLKAAGLDGAVRLVTGDGAHGVADAAPYDRITVTVQAPAIAPAWLEQLAADGVLVVPMRVRGLGRLVSLTPAGDGHWSGGGWLPCGFVRMRGEGANATETIELAPGVRLRVDGIQQLEHGALSEALTGERIECWTGVVVGGSEKTRPVVDLWLATALDNYGRLLTDQQALATVLPGGTPVTWTSTSLAYVTMRPVAGQSDRYEYGVVLHGPDRSLADEVVGRMKEWDSEYRGGAGPVLHVYAEGTDPAAVAPGRVLDRPGPPMVLAWSA
ncbi:protein-L-isoaspartate(D-aspartate) O-methyltransferase [Kitasatospora sp. MAP12-15]|uniref:methyltransferase, FxLD system n=1 Tax=unclassified Kitasatospora TaxID=2633591 RepID=UPI00247621EA|nr:methyltransferase, FxLD system [Kitasatospora sp. MAP12-44]MDH6111431.1 protein-L-isoaspartate(D-aspartate) O-methyltransferase [Kitasatospora sp. MAP12-44]